MSEVMIYEFSEKKGELLERTLLLCNKDKREAWSATY